MVSYVKNYIQDQAIGYLHTGITAAGTMAGNAVGGVGGLIENGGRSIGEGTTGIAGSINGVGGYINNYGDGIRSKFAADGYVGKSASQKAKNEPSEATKPYGLKKLPDASSAGNLVTGASRKILPGSAQPKPSAAATKQVRSAGSVPVGATKKVGGSGAPKALPAPASKSKAAPPAPKPVTNTRAASAPPTKRAAAGAASKPPPGRVNTSTPKPVQPKPGSTGANTNKPSPVAGGKVKVSAASRPRATKKPIPA